jgi:hypothetical protein
MSDIEHIPDMDGDIVTATGDAPFPPSTRLIPGKPGDDDAAYIDELFQPNPNNSDDAIRSAHAQDAEEPAVVCTRILRTTLNMTGTMDPWLAFPPDGNRTHIIVACTQPFRVASEKTGCYTAGDWPYTAQPMDLPGHTGPVWIYCPNAAAAVDITVMAVTR